MTFHKRIFSQYLTVSVLGRHRRSSFFIYLFILSIYEQKLTNINLGVTGLDNFNYPGLKDGSDVLLEIGFSSKDIRILLFLLLLL